MNLGAYDDSTEINFMNKWETIMKDLCTLYGIDEQIFLERFSEYCTTDHQIVKDFCKQLLKIDCFAQQDITKNYTKNSEIVILIKKLLSCHNSASKFDEFEERLKKFDFSPRCGLVWTVNYFAYRCRTCSLSPSMSLCGQCFNAGNHEGHDFNKFKSQAGGACDCGDAYVMRESGFCPHHGSNKASQQVDVPLDLVAPLKALMPPVLSGLLYLLWKSLMLQNFRECLRDAKPVLDLLHELQASGWVAQKLLAEILIDKDTFKKFLSDIKGTDALTIYEKAVKDIEPPFDLPEDKCGAKSLIHTSMMDGFLFACVKLHFPEHLLTFLIGLLTVEPYKLAFVHSYLDHYSRITTVVMQVTKQNIAHLEDAVLMNNRIVHISVQLFSGEVLALQMVHERGLHYLILHCLLNVFDGCTTKLGSGNTQMLRCEHPMVHNNGYWPLISDFINLVSHKSIVNIFQQDLEFLKDWTRCLELLQFINTYLMQEGSHVEYEGGHTVSSAYTVEIEVSSNPMWNMWLHYRPEGEGHKCLSYTKAVLGAIGRYLDGLRELTVRCLSFHLPLMRHGACFCSLALVQHKVPVSSLLTFLTKGHFEKWFWYTVRTLLGLSEVTLGFWVRNGLQIRTSALYYVQTQFCYSLIDLDIFAAQLFASVLEPSFVMSVLLNPDMLLRGIKFNIKEPFFNKRQVDKEPAALEAWFMTLCWILDLRNNMGIPEEAAIRKELICQLTPEPRKRSDLILPERCGINSLVSNVDQILNEIAMYSGPSYDEGSGSLQSGHYSLRPELWEFEFDPMYQSLRSCYRRQYVNAMEKFREQCRVKGTYTRTNPPWPPYRLPGPLHPQLIGLNGLLHARDLHYVFFCCLTMYIYSDPLVTEDSLAALIHVLRRAVLTPVDSNWPADADSNFRGNPFTHQDIQVNLRQSVESASVALASKESHIQRDPDTLLSLLIKAHAKLVFSGAQSSDTSRVGAEGATGGGAAAMSTRMTALAGAKFFDKFPLAYVLPSERGITGRPTEVMVGDGSTYVEHLLDTICAENERNAGEVARIVNSLRCAPSLSTPSLTSQGSVGGASSGKRMAAEMMTREEKKMRAQERQKRLMAQMASKQKAFATSYLNNINMETNEREAQNESANTDLTYECVICQLTSSVNDTASPMVVLGYACPSGLLQQMRNKDDVPVLNSTNVQDMQKDFGFAAVSRTPYPIQSIFVRQLPRHRRSAIIQTCGHFVHEACFRNYREQKMESSRGHRIKISCPLCRRDVNHLTPLFPNPTFLDTSDPLNCVAKMARQKFYNSDRAELPESMDNLDAFIVPDSDDTGSKYREILHSPATLLRNQLEVEVVVSMVCPQQYNALSKRCSWREYMCYMLCLSEVERKKGRGIYAPRILSDLTGAPLSIFESTEEECKPEEFEFGECPLPLVLYDSADVFLSWIPFAWPSRASFGVLLRATFNLAYTRALFGVAMKMGTSEREVWTAIAEDRQATPLELHLALTVSILSEAHLEARDDSANPCTREKLQGLVIRRMLPMLRIAWACYARWTGESYPKWTDLECEQEFSGLCQSLELWQEMSVPCDPAGIVARSGLPIASDVDSMIRAWLEPVVRVMELHFDTEAMLDLGTELYPPRLIRLPYSFDDLFNQLHAVKCRACLDTFPENCCCLICGQLICNICRDAVKHAGVCGGGVGIVFEINTSMIQVTQGREWAHWGSIYLDAYGEEDIDLRRGKPLFLNKTRFDLLEQQWLSHSFRDVIKHWKI